MAALVARCGGGGVAQHVPSEQGEDLLAQQDVTVQLLESLEDGGDVVATARVEHQFLNRHLVEDELWVVDDPHGVFRTKIVLRSRTFRLNIL